VHGRAWAEGEEVTNFNSRPLTRSFRRSLSWYLAAVCTSKRSYDLSAGKDQREIRDKMPAVDVQIRPTGASSASMVISIINRADINIAPLEIEVDHSFEAGDLYLSDAQQSVDKLLSSLSLRAMGTIVPKGVGTMKATLSGVTDGKWDSLTPGLELQFTLRIRFADEQDTIQTFSIVRRIIR
jgi:hypothetical protein